MARIVCLDTNIAIWGILRQGKVEDELKREKAVYLLEVLQRQSDRVLLPAIVLAEVVAKTALADRREVVSLIASACEIVPFDAASASQFGEIRAVGMKKKSREFPRKEISLDSLIVAICRRHGVQTLYTDDDNLCKLAAHFMKVEGLPVIPPQQLPLPMHGASRMLRMPK
jgi:predicted nucleic acid-binding protein